MRVRLQFRSEYKNVADELVTPPGWAAFVVVSHGVAVTVTMLRGITS